MAVLKLKKGAPIMVLRNIDLLLGICNGSRGLIEQMSECVVQIQLLTGTHSGHLVLIPRMTLTSGPDDFPFTLQRRQFPLRLAFAMTINKSQGQSLKLVGIDLRSPCILSWAVICGSVPMHFSSKNKGVVQCRI